VPERSKRASVALIPSDIDDATVEVDGRSVALTNLRKVYFPKLGLTKGDLLRYYLSVAGALLPHVANRPMVMKRYPNGVTSEFRARPGSARARSSIARVTSSTSPSSMIALHSSG
jgi:DNA primase